MNPLRDHKWPGTDFLEDDEALPSLGRVQGPPSLEVTDTPAALPDGQRPDRAPVLLMPALDLTSDEIGALVFSVIGKTQDTMMRTAMEGLNITQARQEELSARAMEKLKDWIDKCKKADAQDKAGGILGWFKRIAGPTAAALGLVVAVSLTVTTVATGGATAPVLLLFLASGIASSSMALANNISAEAGGPDISISQWMAQGFQEMFGAMGVKGEDAENAGLAMNGAMVGLAVLDPAIGGNFASGLAGFAGASDGDKAIVKTTFTAVVAIAITVGMLKFAKSDALKDVSQLIKASIAAGQLTTAALGLTGGAATIFEGVAALEKAEQRLDADMAAADKATIAAELARVDVERDEQFPAITKMMEEMQFSMEVNGEMLSLLHESIQQLIQALSGKKS